MTERSSSRPSPTGASRTIWSALIAIIALVLAALAPAVSSPATGVAPSVAADPGGEIAASLERKFARSGQPQDFWVSFDTTADTSAGREIDDWAERGQYVMDQLRQTADEAQADTVEVLDAAGVDYTAYWIVNAIRIDAGDAALAHVLAGRAGVESVLPAVRYEGPDPVKERITGSRLGINAEGVVEWGVQNVKADQVWSQYGVRGDGIVVANIDTGVQFAHPALVETYRGNTGDGTFSNDYNWFDPATGTSFPDDGNGHGTHTMGTMVGDDGAANQVGVAPGVTWIAARGCESSGCSDSSLLAASQWMLAPTRTDGSDPNPAMRPHIINNSWGTPPSNDPFLEDIQQAWADAGMMGVWSNGNNGQGGCATSGTPGSRILNYSVGAYDSTNTIAGFSSRGPGQDGEIKPNISAPGVNVRSSWLDGSYASSNGTSMAAPHVAGSVALLWSADPSLVGDVAATRQLLDDTAIDTADDQCGGTADDNNVYGEGRLDALALVQATSPGETGTIAGTVTDQDTGDPVPGAMIRLVAGDLTRSTRTGDTGTYTTNLAPGGYQATVTVFGYDNATVAISVSAGQTTTTDIALTPADGYTLSGKVVDARTGHGIHGASVTVAGSRFRAVTTVDGDFAVTDVPGPRQYTVRIDGGGCSQRPVYRTVEVTDHNVTLPTVELARKIDSPAFAEWNFGQPYGYSCVLEPTQWITGDTPLEIRANGAGIDIEDVDLPFPFTYFGRQYSTWNSVIDRMAPEPVGFLDQQSAVLSRTRGSAPNRSFTVEYRDITPIFNAPRYDLAVTLHEDGDVVFAYRDLDMANPNLLGAESTIELRSYTVNNSESDLGYRTKLVFTHNEPALDNALQIRFTLPPSGFVEGTVVDHATREPVPGATVDLYDRFGGWVARAETDGAGHYRHQLFVDEPYEIAVIKPGYEAPPRASAQLTEHRGVKALETVLHGGGMRVGPAGGVTIQRGNPAEIRLTNTGDRDLGWRASTHLPEVDPPAPATELSHVPLHTVLPLSIDEVDGAYWLGGLDRDARSVVVESTASGTPTGAAINLASVAAALEVQPGLLVASDMAWVPDRGSLCMSFFNLVGTTDIACADPVSGDVELTFPTGYSSAFEIDGIAYDPEGDRFFVKATGSGGFRSRIRTLAGVEHLDPGEPLNTCTYNNSSQGLAWNPTSQTLTTNTSFATGAGNPATVELRQFDPATCVDVSVVRGQPGGFTGGIPVQGLDLDSGGDVVVAALDPTSMSTFRSDDRIEQPLRWLTVSPRSGTLRPHESQRIRLDVDWSAVPADVTRIRLVLRGNGGANPTVTIPVTLRR